MQATLFTPPLVAAAIISLTLAAYGWRRNSPGSRPFSLLMVVISTWSLGYGLVLASPDLASKIFWAKASYLGIATAPLAWLAFCVQYTGRGRWVTGRRLAVLALLPLTTLVLVWTNEAHGLVWANVQLDPLSPGLQVQHGRWFWLHMAISYVTFTYGSSLLLWTLVRSSQLYRRQAVPLLVAVAAPWIGNVVYILDVLPIGRLDPTPFAFTLSGLALAWSLFRAHLLECFLGLIPLARDATIEGMRDGVLVVDGQDRVVDMNPAAARILGEAAAEALGAPVRRVLPGWPEIGPDVSGDVTTELSLGTDPDQRYFDLLISPLRPRGEQASGRLVVLRDVTVRKHAEDALRQSETRLLLALEAGRMGIWEWHVDNNTIVWSPGLEAIHGLETGAFGGTFEAYLNEVHPDDRERVQQAIARARDSGGELYIEYRIRWPDGSVRWVEGRGRPFCDQRGQLKRFVGTCMDVTQRKTAEDALVHQALYDSLTGLSNRTLLQDRLAQALQAAERGRRRLALLLMDLDGFKDVNDTLGHHVGDLVLREVGRRLQQTIRTSDTVARLGGDEFAVVLPTVNGVRAAQRAAQRLLRALEPPVEVDGHRLRVGGSVGIAMFPEHGQDGATLLRRADVAMYAAKRARSGHSTFEMEQDEQALGRLTLGTDLHEALKHEQLVLHYQPIARLKDGSITQVEALARWPHPQHGMIPPHQFIPMAEQSGLITQLGVWALRTALAQHGEWSQRGHRLRVSVNLSAQDLQDPRLADTVARLLEASGVPPADLVLEVTEGFLMVDAPRAVLALQRLRTIGVRIAIDDFGTGYSSMSYLKRLPVDTLKVDRSFVSGMAKNESDLAIARATIELGHTLGFEIVAEGVEDQATWELLAELGCDLAQGYLLSPPLPADELFAQLATPLATRSRAGDLLAPAAR